MIVHIQYLTLLPLIYVVSTDEPTTAGPTTEGPTTEGPTTEGPTTNETTTGTTTGKYIRTVYHTYVLTYIHNCMHRIASDWGKHEQGPH